MKIMICGSRNFRSEEVVKAFVDALAGDTEVIVGGASGVDQWAEDAARARGLRVHVYPAQWHLYGRAAGPKRNAEMVKACDQGVAFWDGASRGTFHSISLLRSTGKLQEVIH